VAVHDGQTQENVLPIGDEDTLDELDAVPTLEEPAEAKGAKRKHLRRRVVAWVVLLLFVAAVVALVAWRLLR
jgi:type VI protein secretion system component VasF